MNSVTEIIWKEIPKKAHCKEWAEEVIRKCFEVEHIAPTSFYICVTLTNAENIRKINDKYRNINKETDVLSFPMFEKEELDQKIAQKLSLKPNNILTEETLQDVLGDIIISIPKVEEQAKEYEHSFKREFAYMLVHGFYHLRGYDHMEEEEKKVMRKKEEAVLLELNITRN